MPIQVERRPSEAHDAATAAKQHHHQQQLAHREALRLALGSILTPKRPASASAHHQHSRSASGTASPALPFSAHSVSASGTHTPAEHYLHPHHTGGYHAAPSRLGPSRSTSSSTPSPASSAQASAHPSPRVGGSPATAPALPTVPALDPLPPAVLPAAEPAPATSEKVTEKLNRPPITPLQPNAGASNPVTTGVDVGRARSASDSQEASAGAMSAHASGASTPRAKFLETLQSKRAWDALIHGSFS